MSIPECIFPTLILENRERIKCSVTPELSSSFLVLLGISHSKTNTNSACIIVDLKKLKQSKAIVSISNRIIIQEYMVISKKGGYKPQTDKITKTNLKSTMGFNISCCCCCSVYLNPILQTS